MQGLTKQCQQHLFFFFFYEMLFFLFHSVSYHVHIKILMSAVASVFLQGKWMFLHCVQTRHWHSVSLLAFLRYSVHPFHLRRLSLMVTCLPRPQQDKQNGLHTVYRCPFNPTLLKLTIQSANETKTHNIPINFLEGWLFKWTSWLNGSGWAMNWFIHT